MDVDRKVFPITAVFTPASPRSDLWHSII